MTMPTYHDSPRTTGWIEVIAGCMFSGKTEELIRRLRRAQIARQNVAIFKPKIDTRYSHDHIVSDSDLKIPSTMVGHASEILTLARDAHVVGIDEAQFFDEALVSVCTQLADNGIRVLVAGLDMDFMGKPFGPMPDLMAIAEFVTKVHAICLRCGNLAHFSFRKSDEAQVVLLGEKNLYEPLCRDCYNKAQIR